MNNVAERPKPFVIPGSARVAGVASARARRVASALERRSTRSPGSCRSSSTSPFAMDATCVLDTCPEPYGLRPEGDDEPHSSSSTRPPS